MIVSGSCASRRSRPENVRTQRSTKPASRAAYTSSPTGFQRNQSSVIGGAKVESNGKTVRKELHDAFPVRQHGSR